MFFSMKSISTNISAYISEISEFDLLILSCFFAEFLVCFEKVLVLSFTVHWAAANVRCWLTANAAAGKAATDRSRRRRFVVRPLRSRTMPSERPRVPGLCTSPPLSTPRRTTARRQRGRSYKDGAFLSLTLSPKPSFPQRPTDCFADAADCCLPKNLSSTPTSRSMRRSFPLS